MKRSALYLSSALAFALSATCLAETVDTQEAPASAETSDVKEARAKS